MGYLGLLGPPGAFLGPSGAFLGHSCGLRLSWSLLGPSGSRFFLGLLATFGTPPRDFIAFYNVFQGFCVYIQEERPYSQRDFTVYYSVFRVFVCKFRKYALTQSAILLYLIVFFTFLNCFLAACLN